MEFRRLVGADDEERLLPASDRVDGERMRVEPYVEGWKCGLGQLQPRLWVGEHAPVAGALLDPDLELVDRKLTPGCLCERDMTVVRRVERAAEDPFHPSSTSSPSISTSSPCFAPAALSASVSSSSLGGRPDTR